MKRDTVKKVVSMLKKDVAFYLKKPVDELNIHISKGNRKVGYTSNFSMAPVITCSNCSKCMLECYDMKACCQYGNVRKARAENTAFVLKDMEKAFQAISEYLKRRKKNFFFRFHVAGDIINEKYFCCMVTLAKHFPIWRFWTYTKVYWIVNHWIDENGSLPENLKVMFSKWEGVKMDNPHNLPTFTCVKRKEDAPKGVYHCPGKCKICMENGRGCVAGESAWIEEH